MKDKLAKIIRIIALPPILVTVLMLFLWFTKREFFINGFIDCFAMIAFLGLIPVLAYPAQPFIPKFKGKGRDGQRTLAFIFSGVSYTLGFIYSFIVPISEEVHFFYIAYFISVVILTLLNRVFRIKASGHACSIASPCLFCAYLGLVTGSSVFFIASAIFCVVAGLSVWSSLHLKRHKWKDILFGVATCVLGITITSIII